MIPSSTFKIKPFALLMLALMFAGCSNIHHVTPGQFKAELINMNTMYHCQYIGQADGKAYALRKRTPLFGHKWKEEILVTEAKDLDPKSLKPIANQHRPAFQ